MGTMSTLEAVLKLVAQSIVVLPDIAALRNVISIQGMNEKDRQHAAKLKKLAQAPGWG